jgi:thymidylate kinase
LYRKFEMPDLLVVLEVSPEVSMQRKPDHREEAIEAKNQALRALRAGLEADSRQGNWAHLNADLPFEGVLNQLKQAIWAAL